MVGASSSCGHTFYVLLQALFVVALCGHALAANEVNEDGLSDVVIDQLSDDDLYNSNKRTWQSLQNSWGKRGDDGASEEAIYVTGHFVPLLITDGENTLDWSAFQRLANSPQQRQRQQQKHQKQQQQSEEISSELDDTVMPANDMNTLNEKRSWKNMNVAWGKRRQSQNWNKFSGAWGKREPSWNNLKGMWGKRAQWQKLQGGWGKRSAMN